MSHLDSASQGAAPILTFPHLGYILHLKHFAVILYSCGQSVLALKLQLINIQAGNSSANMCHVFWLWEMAQTSDVLSELLVKHRGVSHAAASLGRAAPL